MWSLQPRERTPRPEVLVLILVVAFWNSVYPEIQSRVRKGGVSSAHVNKLRYPK